MMQRRAFLLTACALPLAGCGNVLGPGEPPQIYMVHANFPPAPAGAKVPWALAVMRPDTTDALDTVRIPIVKADGTMDYYAAAQFPDRVTAVVQDALVAGFEASGRIDQVSTEQDTLHADYDLVSEIRDFEAKYDAPDGIPTILVTISVKLATVRGRRIVGSFTTAQKVPASANSTAAATQAFETALVAASNEVVAWALSKQLPLPG